MFEEKDKLMKKLAETTNPIMSETHLQIGHQGTMQSTSAMMG
jgi:hypothetical protein